LQARGRRQVGSLLVFDAMMRTKAIRQPNMPLVFLLPLNHYRVAEQHQVA